MFPEKKLEARLGEILDELDGLAGVCEGSAAEALEDLNAELEDALLLLSELKPTDDDWREECAGALETVLALAEDYRALAKDVPDIVEPIQSLEAAANTALGALAP